MAEWLHDKQVDCWDASHSASAFTSKGMNNVMPQANREEV